MNRGVIRRTAIDRYLKLVRVPLDAAIGLLPGDGTSARRAARLAVHELDARVRAVVAMILSDSGHGKRAQQRRNAASKRTEAVNLRMEPETAAESAEARLERRQARVARTRNQPQERPNGRREHASRDRPEHERNAGKALEARAPGERLETPNAQRDAKRRKDKELAARDESRRLREAASRAKSGRRGR